MLIFDAVKRKRYEKNAVATTGYSALRNIFPQVINQIKTIVMKRNFYLQHPLMAMHDPRMQDLFKRNKTSCTLSSEEALSTNN